MHGPTTPPTSFRWAPPELFHVGRLDGLEPYGLRLHGSIASQRILLACIFLMHLRVYAQLS